MKSFKKLAALALAGIMSVTVFAVSAFAFDTDAKIITRWDETGTYLIATVVTNGKAGAVKGTLTYENATIEQSKGNVIEEDVTVAEAVKWGTSDVTFAVTAKDLKEGDTVWAEFYFTVEAGKTAKFTLTETQACNIGEELDANGIDVSDTTVAVTAAPTKALGAQYRAGTGNEAAIRFGSRIDRVVESDKTMITVDNKKYAAVSCGYLMAWSDIVSDETLVANVDNATGKVTAQNNKVAVIDLTKCKESTQTYLIYTMLLNGFYKENGTTEIKYGETSAMDIPLKATPYVVYEDNGEYKIAHGNTVVKSYRDVQNDANAIETNIYK